MEATSQFDDLHTVNHFADDDRLRLSTLGSPAKLTGLTRFWNKHGHRMDDVVRHEYLDRNQKLFGWLPPKIMVCFYLILFSF